MRSELDGSTRKDRLAQTAVIIGGSVLFILLLAFLIYRKQNMEMQSASEVNSETTSQVVSEEPAESIPGEALGLGIDETDSEEETEEASETKYMPGELIAENTYQLPEGESVTFTFAGDVLLDDSYAIMSNYVAQNSVLENCIDESLLTQMREADVCMINNEFTYTEETKPISNKTFTFKAKPENVNILKEMGVDVVSLGNNHVYDYGEKGLYDTIATLEGAGIPYVGGGKNIEDASKILYYQNDEMKIALISATQIERYPNPNTKEATETTPGTFRCYESEKLLEKIEEADANSDFVIVYLHWGTESTDQTDWRQTSQASECALAGADVIIGAHPHVIQGIGYEGDVPVFYSLGNFWFSSKNLDSSILNLEISKDGLVSSQFVPCLTRNCSTLEAKDGEKDRILSYMRRLSPEAVIDENGFVNKSIP